MPVMAPTRVATPLAAAESGEDGEDVAQDRGAKTATILRLMIQMSPTCSSYLSSSMRVTATKPFEEVEREDRHRPHGAQKHTRSMFVVPALRLPCSRMSTP